MIPAFGGLDPVGNGRDQGDQEGPSRHSVGAFDQPHEGEFARSINGDEEIELSLDGLNLGDIGGRCLRAQTWNGYDEAFSRKLGERGWLGVTWPRQYGGQELSALERYVVVEELLAAGAPVSAHWIAERQSGPTKPMTATTCASGSPT